MIFSRPLVELDYSGDDVMISPCLMDASEKQLTQMAWLGGHVEVIDHERVQITAFDYVI